MQTTDLAEMVPDTEPLRQYYFIGKLKKIAEEKSGKLHRPLTANVTTFGCQMNARDSEKMRGILTAAGFEMTESENADFLLFNTCTVRENANQKVYGRLGQLKSTQKENPDRVIALCGCMMQEKDVTETIKKSYRHVGIIFGTHNIYKLAELLVTYYSDPAPKKRMIIDVQKEPQAIVEDLPNVRKFPFKGSVNIMFGCDNFCSYCIVPYVRGRERSRKPEDIINEIKGLAKDGVKEVMLLGQNVNSYGKTLTEPTNFSKLLEKITKIEGICRIRFMTSHPKDLSDDLIAVMAGSDKICKHLHLPLQSGSTRLLEQMNRHYTKESYLRLVEKLRAAMPDIAITTDIIVGFPGETQDDFKDTLDVVKKAQFDNAFTFLYSKRTGTPAAAMKDQIPEDVAKERFDRLLDVVKETAKSKAEKTVGTVENVLAEQVNKKDPKLISGRTEKNVTVHFPGDSSLIGQIIPVSIEKSMGFYYLGKRR